MLGATKHVTWIGREAPYRGLPDQATIRLIQSLTRTDNDGRRYYRTMAWNPWRRLRGKAAFAELNRAVDVKVAE